MKKELEKAEEGQKIYAKLKIQIPYTGSWMPRVKGLGTLF